MGPGVHGARTHPARLLVGAEFTKETGLVITPLQHVVVDHAWVYPRKPDLVTLCHVLLHRQRHKKVGSNASFQWGLGAITVVTMKRHYFNVMYPQRHRLFGRLNNLMCSHLFVIISF